MTPPLQPTILCIGLTPALQRTLVFDGVRLGDVNRAQSATLSAAGKGVNVARVLKILGSHPFLVGFLGGDTGKVLADELKAEAIPCDWVPAAQPTRNCHTLIDKDTGLATELVEEMACPSPEEWAELDRRLQVSIPSSAFVVLIGKLPPGSHPDVYAKIIRTANEHGVKGLLDTQGPPLLEALAHRPFLVKLNAHELGATLGQRVDSESDVEDLMRELHRLGATWVMVTQGAKAAFLLGKDGLHRFHPPEIEAVNPIGSGDAVAAGIVHALLQGEPVAEAAAHGLACGTAGAMEFIPGAVDPNMLERMRSLVQVEGPHP